jgi:PilZ domain
MAPPAKSRRYPRIGLPRGLYVAWQGIGDRVVSRGEVLGMGGLFIEVSDPPPVGESLRLYFEVPGGDVRARGTVRSSQKGKGMGVEFIAMGQEGRARLHRLLRRLLADPTGKPQRE